MGVIEKIFFGLFLLPSIALFIWLPILGGYRFGRYLAEEIEG